MADRSKIIRHRDVVFEEFTRIADRIAWLRRELEEAEEELRQVAGIAHDMMPRRTSRQQPARTRLKHPSEMTPEELANASGSSRVHLPPEGDQ